MDVLGFKDARREKGNEAILRALDVTRECIEENQQQHNQECHGVQAASYYFMSDTIKVAVVPERDSADSWIMIRDVARILSRLCYRAVEGDPPLKFRGAISYGEILTDTNYAIGHAVEEAAALFESAEGAFVFLTPSALDEVESRLNGFETEGQDRMSVDQLLPMWPIPMKGGGAFHTRVVSPFDPILQLGDAEIKSYCERLLGSFRVRDISVRMKGTATAAFLNHAVGLAIGPSGL